jgi:hypothetical protein
MPRTVTFASVLCIVLLLSVPVGAQQSANLPSLSKMTLEGTFPKNPNMQALALAAAKGDVREIDRLVGAGANVNTAGAYGLTVTAWVAGHPNKDGLRRLLELGADPNKVWAVDGEGGRSLVHWAASSSLRVGLGYLKMVLEIGKGDPNLEAGSDRVRPIECAVQEGQSAPFVLLYKAGAKLNGRAAGAPGRMSLLERAAYGVNGNYRTVLFCLEHGAGDCTAERGAPDGQRALAGLHESIEKALRNRWIAGRPGHPQYMWFWRTVDFLERHGQTFAYDFPSSRPLERPKQLDRTPVELAMTAPHPWSAAHFEANLLFPGPLSYDADGATYRAQPILKRSGNLIEYTYPPQGTLASGHGAVLQVVFLYAPGTSLPAAADFAKKHFAEAFGLACSFTKLEDAADHQVLRVEAAGAPGVGGCLYVGKYKDTIAAVRQTWWSRSAEEAAWYRARALESMQLVTLGKGYASIPPALGSSASCASGCGKPSGGAQ